MKFIPSAASRKVARTLLQGQKHSPQILFGVGLAAFVGTIVLSNRATLRLDAVLEHHDEGIFTIENLDHGNDYTETDRRKDTIYVYGRTTREIAKLYGPSIVCGVVAVASLTGSHHILSKRNVALAAAYAGLEKAFNDYRYKVQQAIGEDKERPLFYEMEGTAKKQIIVGTGYSQYAKFFDENSTSWSPTAEYNLLFLRCQQNYANDRLVAKGHVFLNEVYDMLGLERTSAGAVVGWLHDSANGDNYIDFGVFNSSALDSFYDFVKGHEGVWLDFNVDGVIYENI